MKKLVNTEETATKVNMLIDARNLLNQAYTLLEKTFPEITEDVLQLKDAVSFKAHSLQCVIEALNDYSEDFEDAETSIEDLVDPNFWDNIDDVLAALDEDEEA